MPGRVRQVIAIVRTRQVLAYTGSLALQGGGAFLGLVFQAALASWLHAAGYGLLSTVVAITTILGLIGTVGTNGAALRFVPGFETEEDHSSAVRFVSFSLSTTFLASVALAVGFVVAAGIAHGKLTTLAALAGGLLILVTGMQLAATDLARLGRRFVKAYSSVLILRPAAIAVLVGIAAWTGVARSVTLALLFLAVGTGIGLVFQLRAIDQGFGRHALAPVRPQRDWLRASPPYLVITAFQLVLAQVDLLAVSAFLSSTSVGYYAAALRISSVLTLPYVAVMAVIRPSISRLASESRDVGATLNLVTQATAWCGMATAVLALPLLIWPKPILHVFGASYQTGAVALQWLAISQVIISSMGPGGVLLVYMDRRRVAITASAVWTVLSAVACGAGALADGINGAAIGSAASAVMVGASTYLLTWHYLGIRVSFVEAFIPALRQRPEAVTEPELAPDPG